MKNASIFISLFIFSLFIFSDKLYAIDVIATDLPAEEEYARDINPYTNNEFNFFYEKSQNSEIYQLLVQEGNHLPCYLDSYYACATSYNYFFSLYTAEEFNNIASYHSSLNEINVSSTYNYDNVIVLNLGSGGIPGRLSKLEDNDYMTFNIGTGNNSVKFYYMNGGSLVYSKNYAYNNATAISFRNFFTQQYKFYTDWKSSAVWWNPFTWRDTEYNGCDFSFLLSKFYLSNYDITYSSSYKPDIDLLHFVQNGTAYDVNDVGFDIGLMFYKSRYIISETKPMKNLYYSLYQYNPSPAVIPGDFISLEMLDYDRVVFIPKVNSSLRPSDYMFYNIFSNLDTFLSFQYFETLVNFSDESNIYNYNLIPNKYSAISLSFPYIFNGNEAIVVQKNNTKYSAKIWYSPNAYQVLYLVDHDDSETYTNINTQEENTIDYFSFLDMYSVNVNNDTHTPGIILDGESCPVFNGKGGRNVNGVCMYDEEGNYNPGTITGTITSSSSDLSFSNILSNAIDNMSSFVAGAITIANLGFGFFGTMPADIQAVLMTLLIIGVTIIVIKIIL